MMRASSSKVKSEKEPVFPVEKLKEKLRTSDAETTVADSAAVYCAAILDFLTNKVLSEAVRGMDDASLLDSPLSGEAEERRSKKRSRVECESSDSSTQPTAERSSKKRRLCPADIKRVLTEDFCVSHWLPPAEHCGSASLAGLCVVFEGSLADDRSAIIEDLALAIGTADDCDGANAVDSEMHSALSAAAVSALLSSPLPLKQESADVSSSDCCGSVPISDSGANAMADVISDAMHGSAKESVEEMADASSVSRNVGGANACLNLSADSELCRTLLKEMSASPKQFALPLLWQYSTVVAQQFHFRNRHCAELSQSQTDTVLLCDGSDIQSLALAMFFVSKQWLSAAHFRAFLSASDTSLFKGPTYKPPDIYVFVRNCATLRNALSAANWISVLDDFVFELTLKSVASLSAIRRSGKPVSRWLFVDASLPPFDGHYSDSGQESAEDSKSYTETELKAAKLKRGRIWRRFLEEAIRGKVHSPRVFWEPVIHPSIFDASVPSLARRIVYKTPAQVSNGMKLLKSGKTQMADSIYIHISLWMKPTRRTFKRLVVGHLCRGEDIYFFANGVMDCDATVSKIVQWVFSQASI